jgi:perosamine synthetase
LIPYGKHHIDDDDISAVVEVLRSGALTQGPMVSVFEQTIAEYVGAKYAVAVSSGTAALHIAHLALELLPGDKAVTTPNTFVATANAAAYVGAESCFSDIDSQSLNLCPDALLETCQAENGVKLITPVHFAGLACDMVKIKQVSESVGAAIIEDAAHALGARYATGERVGSCQYSDMTVFSFHPVKMIASGEGGVVTTNSDELYQKLLLYRSHGVTKQSEAFLDSDAARMNGEVNAWYYEMQALGYNYRLSDIHCALAMSQFKKLQKFLLKRQALAAVYDQAFAENTICKPAQVVLNKENHSRHIYVLKINFEKLGVTRNDFMRRLSLAGIGSQVHYIPVYSQPYYRDKGFERINCPICDDYYSSALTIPLFYELSDDQQAHIISTIQKLTGSA